MSLPDDDPVYTLKKVMEEMDFSSLMAQYSNKGRNGYNPIMKYAVLTYANMRGVKSVDRIVELLKLQMNPVKIAEGEEIPFVYEKRHTKTEIQQLYEELEECTKRLMKYKNYFIVHGYVSNDRTDYTTLVPELKKHFAAFGETLKEVTADSGIAAKKIFYS